MRAFVSFTLLAHTAEYLAATRVDVFGWIVIALSVISAACLLIGFMTPVVAVVVTIGGSALALSGLFQATIEIVVLTLAVGLLGPGAFSLDARRFGRREIFLPHTQHVRRNPDA